MFPMFCGFFSSRAAIWLLAPSVPLPVTGVGQTNTGMAAGLIFAQCGLLIRPVNWTPPFLERYPSCTRATPSGSRAVQSHPPPSIRLFSLSSFVQAVMVCHSQRQGAGSLFLLVFFQKAPPTCLLLPRGLNEESSIISCKLALSCLRSM